MCSPGILGDSSLAGSDLSAGKRLSARGAGETINLGLDAHTPTSAHGRALLSLLLECQHALVDQRLQLMLPLVTSRIAGMEATNNVLDLARQACAFMLQVCDVGTARPCPI